MTKPNLPWGRDGKRRILSRQPGCQGILKWQAGLPNSGGLGFFSEQAKTWRQPTTLILKQPKRPNEETVWDNNGRRLQSPKEGFFGLEGLFMLIEAGILLYLLQLNRSTRRSLLNYPAESLKWSKSAMTLRIVTWKCSSALDKKVARISALGFK